MLILTRKEGQSIKIKPNEKLSRETPVDTLFANGPIEVKVNRIQGNQVRLGIIAHPDLVVLRDELCDE